VTAGATGKQATSHIASRRREKEKRSTQRIRRRRPWKDRWLKNTIGEEIEKLNGRRSVLTMWKGTKSKGGRLEERGRQKG